MIKKILEQFTQDIDDIPQQHIGLCIVLAAALSLLAELMIIRLHSSYFQLFAFLKNISLLSCFLGLGIGYVKGNARLLFTPFFLPLLTLQILVLHFIKSSAFAASLQNPIKEQFTMGLATASNKDTLSVYLFLISIFILNALCFVPLGQLISRLMARQERLTSYSFNLLGSLIGIILFTYISFRWLPPIAWILVVTGMLVPFLFKRLSIFLTSILSLIVILIVLLMPGPSGHFEIYSPYQKLTLIISKNKTIELNTSNTYYQHLFNLRTEIVQQNKNLKTWAQFYNFPYLFKNNPDQVLIVGSGTGNDVAAALRNNTKSITAVEIDPAVLEIGRLFHPESPYQNDKVHTVINDARTFIRYTKNQYDLIVYGRLDSHSLLTSNASGIRLDSYIYTVEAFKEARKKLKEDGIICVTLTVRPHLEQKIFSMLQEAFDGQKPLVYKANYARIFIAGDHINSRQHLPLPLQDVSAEFENKEIKTDNSTDDWPFFYMPQRIYPASYALLLFMLLMISTIFIRTLVKEAISSLSWPCFFLGAGFMLIETKGITELSLVWGSTWLVINIMIISILLMAFVANLLVIKKCSPSTFLTYGLLAISVLIGYAFTFIDWSDLNQWIPQFAVPAVLSLPVFFSGFAFSKELKNSSSIGAALSSNLLGAMLGGALEYNSMYFGFRSLYIVALIIYGFAFLTTKKTLSLR